MYAFKNGLEVCLIKKFQGKLGTEIGLDRHMAWAKRTHTHTHSQLEKQSLSFSCAVHYSPPMMPSNKAGNPSCTVLGWISVLLTPRRSGLFHVSGAFPLPRTCGTRAADGKQEWTSQASYTWRECRVH